MSHTTGVKMVVEQQTGRQRRVYRALVEQMNRLQHAIEVRASRETDPALRAELVADAEDVQSMMIRIDSMTNLD
jgi:hypothetical protein